MAISAMHFHYLNSVQYLEHMAMMARYYHLPIGNLCGDSLDVAAIVTRAMDVQVRKL